MELEWYILDVFVDPKTKEVPHGGNQLAVFFLDDESLSTGQLQAIATEVGYSETTFVYEQSISFQQRSARGVLSAKTRIFTIEQELPFAGHPTLGTAWCLRYLQDKEQQKIRTVKVSLVLPLLGETIEVVFDDNNVGTMTQAQPIFGRTIPYDEVYSLLGIRETSKPGGALADVHPQIVSTGIPFLICRLPTPEDVSVIDSRIDKNKFNQFMDASRKELIGVYFFSEGGLGLRSRMLFYEGGVFTEDPATGSASGCCLSYLLETGETPKIDSLVVEQGVEMGRRSLVLFSGRKHPDGNFTIQIGGSCVLVSKGSWMGKVSAQ